MAENPLHVAIIGGGLCGLALAIALSKRSIPYTIYEARGSFTEIGAGINLGPNSIQAFDSIDPKLREAIFELATRNGVDKDIWMTFRLGAPTKRFEDGHTIVEIRAPPTGNMTVSRNELLQMLAKHTPPENAKFNKKISHIQQDETGVQMTFEDGTEDTASLLIACDGAHSTVRRLMLGPEHPAVTAKFTHTGGYRAVFPIEVHEAAVGVDKAYSSQFWGGPGGYVIMYPIDSRKNVNIGLWPKKPGSWDSDTWVLHNQKAEMLKDFEAWGPHIQKVMSLMPEETQFWATFHHSVQPDSLFDGRVCLIGDAAHAMSPHQGQGAAQAMEDVSVMSAVLQTISQESSAPPLAAQIEAAFSSHQAVRRPRSQAILESSVEAHEIISTFCRHDLTERDIEECAQFLTDRFKRIWNADIPGQCERAVAEMLQRLKGGAEVNGTSSPHE